MPASNATAAVFLSYAREDTDSARRIADALRASGVEVWFDQSELRGGDTWDSKIKTQIRECALFLAVISANTQARREGYFRREWNLAVERTLDMAHGTPFLLPVVVDDTRESAALVPEQFMRVQWTRLTSGAVTPDFSAQVKRLLAPAEVAPASSRQSPTNAGKMPALPKPRPPGWTWPAVAVVAIAVVAFLLTRKSEPTAAPPKAVAETKPAAPTSAPAPALPPLAPEKSVAVLPFENKSPDKDDALFTDGVHEDVITSLTKIRDLKVIGRTSVLSYRDPATRNHKQIAADLGVATLLEGTVRRAGSKVRVTAQLINARTDESLWAETYDVDLTDAFTIQSALAQKITAALKSNFTPGERAYVAERPTQNLEAYDLYLRAQATFGNGNINNAGGREIMERAIALYEQAVAKDPTFVAAYAQLAYINGRMTWYAYFDQSPARRERAKAALDAALRLAPDKPETQRALGAYAYYCDHDWSRALAAFRVASISLPNDPQLVYFIGLTLRRMGSFQEAITYFVRSVELDPRESVRVWTLVLSLKEARRYTEASALAARYQAVFPDDSQILFNQAMARLEITGDRVAFFREWEAVPPSASDPFLIRRRYELAKWRGDFAAARVELSDPRLTSAAFGGTGGTSGDLVELHRALDAFLSGRSDEARALADEAIKFYASKPWQANETTAVMMGTALAEALAGREEKAVATARDGYARELASDPYVAGVTRLGQLGEVYLILNRREDAFGVLRQMIMSPVGSGREWLRIHPLWSRLKDDPRFEEYLKLAKQL